MLCIDLRILYIPREEEECCRVEEREGDGKDESGWGERGVVRTRHQRQLSEEDGDQEKGEVRRRVENVHQCGHVSLDKRVNNVEGFCTSMTTWYDQ